MGESVRPHFFESWNMIIYMYASAWLLTTNRRYWTNARRRYGQFGATQHATLSGPVPRKRAVNLTYSTSILMGRGQDFDMLNPTRPLVRC